MQETVISPFLTHWGYCSLALSHRYIPLIINTGILVGLSDDVSALVSGNGLAPSGTMLHNIMAIKIYVAACRHKATMGKFMICQLPLLFPNLITIEVITKGRSSAKTLVLEYVHAMSWNLTQQGITKRETCAWYNEHRMYCITVRPIWIDCTYRSM